MIIFCWPFAPSAGVTRNAPAEIQAVMCFDRRSLDYLLFPPTFSLLFSDSVEMDMEPIKIDVRDWNEAS